jgi:hypothetical protein
MKAANFARRVHSVRDSSRSARKKDIGVRLVYLLSASHSGSTLMAMVLGSHPEIATVGELKFTSLGALERYRCSCREEIQKCGFWKEIVSDMRSRGNTFDLRNAGTDFRSVDSAYARNLLRPLHRGKGLELVRDAALSLSPIWRREYREIQARNSALIRSISACTGKRIVVDTSKIAIRLKYLLRNPDIEISVVRLIRDGRAVALTYKDSAAFADASEQEFRGGGMGITGDYPQLSMKEAAWEWRRSNEEAENVLKDIDPARLIEVRYESFCRNPQEESSRIFSFLGVQPADALACYRNSIHHVIGNGMRLDTRREVVLDERWREILTSKDIDIFISVAGDINHRLGYR